MDDKELLELQQKADSGDAVACICFIRKMRERMDSDSNKSEDDCRIVWEYSRKLAKVKTNVFNKEDLKYFRKNLFRFYKEAKDYNRGLSYDPYSEEMVKYYYLPGVLHVHPVRANLRVP